MARGFVYLVAIMEWYSRKVLSWRVSNTLDARFCVDALEEAIETHGTPEIFNTDQGSQFTSEDFTGVLKTHGIRISMDGKGRCCIARYSVNRSRNNPCSIFTTLSRYRLLHYGRSSLRRTS